MASQMKYDTDKLIDLLGMADVGNSLANMLNQLDSACEGDTLSIRAILRELNYIQRDIDLMLAEERAEHRMADEAARLEIEMDIEDRLDYKFRTGRYCNLV